MTPQVTKNLGASNATGKSKRWYYQYKHLTQLLELTRQFPEPLQKQVGLSLTLFVKKAYERLSLSQELKNMGAEKVLGLYMAQQKRRWSDRIPELHYALKFLATTPPDILKGCDVLCVEVVAYINSQMNQKRAVDQQSQLAYTTILRFLQSDENPLHEGLDRFVQL